MTFEEALASIEAKFPILSKTEFRGETTLVVEPEKIVEVCAHAKSLGFDMLIDLSSVDNFGQEPRFEVVYELYSLEGNYSLRLKTTVSEDNLEIDSVVSVWETANWHEREVYDMMGIRFRNHPDLRRILMPEDWEGHPLRKDYEVGSIPVQFKGAPS